MLVLPPITLLPGCNAGKSPLSVVAFELARQQCGANDAYILKSAPNVIAFHSDPDENVGHARCLEQKLKGTNAQIVLVGSRLYKN